MVATILSKPAAWSLESLRERLAPPLEGSAVERAIVFGSYARGTADGYSDLDLAVVMQTSLPRLERPRLLDAVYRAIPLGLDLIVLTPEEYDLGVRERWGVFEPILQEGVTIYERCREAT